MDTVIVDSREKQKAIQKILAEFDAQGVHHVSSKLYCGDYTLLKDQSFIIDRKQNCAELCSNVCQQHKRFTDELKRANGAGIKLVFLCEHGGNIKTLEDVLNWQNPRLKVSPMAVSGERLYRILSTMEKTYNTKFLFCDKRQTGKRIIELLEKRNIDD